MADARPAGFPRRAFLTAGSGAAAGAASGLAGCAKSVSCSGGAWERPLDQRGKGNRRNLILLVSDTFRADNLQVYGGNGLVSCPRLDRFAEDCVAFEDCYPDGMPTIPTRRAVLTGRRVTPCGVFHQHSSYQLPGWHRLFHEDQTLAETLREAGYSTALIADNPHFQMPGMDFHRGYGYFEWTRRAPAAHDRFAPEALRSLAQEQYPPEVWDAWEEIDADNAAWIRRLLATADRLRAEDGSVIERTARQAIRWLRAHREAEPFFLHLEAFDPHEPWLPPRRFLDPYLPNAAGPKWHQPPLQGVPVPPSGVDRLRANYAASATEVDFWLGEVLATAEELGLFDNSVVVFFSDHGALLGEQGHWCKGSRFLRRQVTHTPLLVRLPGRERAGARASGLMHHPDVLPTLLQLLELEPPPRATGRNLWGLVAGEASPHEGLVQCYGPIASVRTRDWQFSKTTDSLKHALSHFETLGYVTAKTGLGTPYAAQLYSRTADPDELTDVASQNPAVVAQLGAMIDRYLEAGEEIARGHFHAPEDHAPRPEP